MSTFRMPLPAVDGRLHREEDYTLARLNTLRNARVTPPEPNASTVTASRTNNMAVIPTSEPSSAGATPVHPRRRRLVFPDPVAFRFLEQDPSVAVLNRRTILQGYELYLVEQWACSRKSPTLVIVTYTGDTKHSVTVGILDVPIDEKEWSVRLKFYLKEIQTYARPKETELGELMVTNLSSFPSALTVIPVPDGDIRKHRQMFIANEDLKRLGCSGRSAMTLSEPTPATQAKFMQIYKTSSRVNLIQAVLELVKICQLALFLFGKLEQTYIDGLLCDVTETAINNWWTEIGSGYFNVELNDGIMGPTTVAALLGTLMGARNRLSYYGAPVAKDVFDIDSTKRAIGVFQKACKIEKTRRLDRQTLLELHNATAKAAAREAGWGVQKAVKSTIGEFGGKKGELVMGMVSGREKANIGDVETTDLEKFISLVVGERAKWLWHGKTRRTQTDPNEHSMSDLGNMLFSKESRELNDIGPQAASGRVQSMPIDDEVDARRIEDSPGIYSATAPASATSMLETTGDKDALRKNVFKSVAGKVSDARSGLGRIRDAVGGGLRSHTSRLSKDEPPELLNNLANSSIGSLAQSSSAALTSPVMVGRAFTWKNKPEEYLNALRRDKEMVDSNAKASTSSQEPEQRATDEATPDASATPLLSKDENITAQQAAEVRRELVTSDPSVTGSVVGEGDLKGPILMAELTSGHPLTLLQRRHSIMTVTTEAESQPNQAKFPHRLSFSDAEEAVLRWREITVPVLPEDANKACSSDTEVARRLYASLAKLQDGLGTWAASKVSAVEGFDESLGQQVIETQAMYYDLSEAYQRIKHGSSELLGGERAGLTEAVKDVEALVARLDYEINALVGKVQDVEESVANFETQVEEVERRADELKVVLETETWLHWFVRTMTGIGTGPNITMGVALAETETVGSN